MGRNSAIRASSPVDVYVGARIRKRRNQAGLSLEALGKAVGCSMQQLRKYESAENRISAGMLARVSAALATRPGYFFDGYELLEGNLDVEVIYHPSSLNQSMPRRPDTEHLLKCADKISDPGIRSIIHSLAKYVDQ